MNVVFETQNGIFCQLGIFTFLSLKHVMHNCSLTLCLKIELGLTLILFVWSMLLMLTFYFAFLESCLRTTNVAYLYRFGTDITSPTLIGFDFLPCKSILFLYFRSSYCHFIMSHHMLTNHFLVNLILISYYHSFISSFHAISTTLSALLLFFTFSVSHFVILNINDFYCVCITFY